MTDEIPVHETTRTRRRWGCTCGCLVIFLIGFIGISGVLFQLLRPTPYHSNWLSPHVDGFGHLSLSQNDEGVGDLLGLLLKRIQARAQALAPESERKLAGASMTVARKTFDQFVQPETVILLSHDPDQQLDTSLFAFQFKNRMAVLLATLYLNKTYPAYNSDVANTTQSLSLFSLSKNEQTSVPLLALAGRTLLFSNSLPLIQQVGETVNGKVSEGATEQLQSYLDSLSMSQPPPGRDLAFAALTPPGRLRSWLVLIEQKFLIPGFSQNFISVIDSKKANLDDIQGITISGDVISDDEISFVATLWGPPASPDKTKRLAEALKLAVNQTLDRAEGAPVTQGLKTQADVKQPGTSIVVGLTVSGIKRFLDSVLPAPPPPPKAPAPAVPAAP